jgi:hypothetical protein
MRLATLLSLAPLTACISGSPAGEAKLASTGDIVSINAPIHSVFRGMCDASAAVLLDPEHVVVADDETNVLRAYRITGGDPVAVSKSLSEAAGATPKDGAYRELDLEGAARIGDVVYWIGSHGNNKSGKARPGRHRLIATKVILAGDRLDVEVVGVFRDLLPQLGEAVASFGVSDQPGVAPKAAGGTNIEGLAATPEGHLLIGFRNPLKDGLALVVHVSNPVEMTTQGAPPKVVATQHIGLGATGGLGVRAMESRYPSLLIVAGPTAGGGPFVLHSHPANGPGIPIPKGLNAEALFIAEDGVHLLSDDGTVAVGDGPCKEAPDALKSFRGVVLSEE